jgi:FkbM family methyltransferase
VTNAVSATPDSAALTGAGLLRAEAVARITRLYPFNSGCGTLANHPLVDVLAGRPKGDAWAKVEGGRLFVSLEDHVGRAAFYVGDLDRKISLLIDRFVKPGDTVLDIGANIGLVSLRLSKRVGAEGIVHAFEPNPRVSNRLLRSLEESRITNVRLHEVGLGDVPGTLRLVVPEGNAGAASLIADRVSGESCEVPVKRLDDFEFGPISFVKMDVEGYEENVLRGFSRTVSNCPPRVILFEQNDPSGTSIRLLEEAGYRIFGVAKSLLRLILRPVSSWHAGYNDYVAIAGQR